MQKLSLALFCLSLPLFFANCGKKKETEKKETNNELAFSTTKNVEEKTTTFAHDSEFLDSDTNDLADFAFIDNDDADEAINGTTASNEQNTSNELAMDAIEADEEDLVAFQGERVQFDFDKNDIRNDQTAALEKNYQVVKKALEENKEITISGHTCQMGSARHNLALSLKRAEAVKKEMVNRLASEAVVSKKEAQEKIKTMGLGFESPLVWSDETDRVKRKDELAINRRAELSVN